MTIEQWAGQKTEKGKLLLASGIGNANALMQRMDSVGIKVTNLLQLAKSIVIESFAFGGEIREIQIIDGTLASAIISKLFEEYGEELSFVPKILCMMKNSFPVSGRQMKWRRNFLLALQSKMGKLRRSSSIMSGLI